MKSIKNKKKRVDQKKRSLDRQTLALAAQLIGQGRQSPVDFLCSMDKHCCLPYHFSDSKFIFLPVHIEHFEHFVGTECKYICAVRKTVTV